MKQILLLKSNYLLVFILISFGGLSVTGAYSQDTFIVPHLPENPEGVLINEIMPSNSTTICDEDGDYPDWIELYNNSPNPIDLENYMISDDDEEPDKWIFPTVIIDPYGFLLIFASGKDRLEGPYLHTNFKIKASGEPVIISNPSGNIIDQLNAGEIDSDISFGRKPDGSGQLEYFYITSPGSTNANNSISCASKFHM